MRDSFASLYFVAECFLVATDDDDDCYDAFADAFEDTILPGANDPANPNADPHAASRQKLVRLIGTSVVCRCVCV